ncbi:aspartate kinase [Proteiniclasticum sp. BAD-10]|uniref:Aspartokinase n=1 Tax=Proteiniclasticum sediminis TaxID=2804028 RepID=A0A941CQX3_9CLOT|nr:aspartate kinase [Proteiniclasticum sediminis]MBR0577125.1 aspartate kinase [Proteiniclasticum sediminis]
MRTVLKFGGSSVADVPKMKEIARKIKARQEQGESIVVVVSAMGKTTSQLLELAQTAAKNPSKREVDMMISTGEQVSIALLAMILNEMGVEAVSFTGFQAGILTGGMHTKTKILDIDITAVEKQLNEGRVVVVAGFQGYNEEGEITTLGRGGSDTTAVALAAKLGCRCEIYTDVPGIYGVDPRLYPKAHQLQEITWEEMKEMAFLGAKVMEPRSVDIAQHYGVEIYVGSAHEDCAGTYIRKAGINVEQRSITGLSVADNILMVTLRNLPEDTAPIASLFTRLAKEEINVDMIAQIPMESGGVGLSFTAQAQDQGMLEEVLKEEMSTLPGVTVELEKNIFKLSVVGSGMRTQSGVAAKVFQLLSENDIRFKQVTTSEISISYTLDQAHKEKAVRIIAEAFEL